MNFDDVQRTWGFGNQMMPHQLTVLHVPTGIQLTGNCKHEQSKLRLERDLTDELAIRVAKEEAANPSLIRKSAAETENERLRAQLEQMQRNIQQLLDQAAKPVPSSRVATREERGPGSARQPKTDKSGLKSKRGWSPEQRAAAAQRMKDRQAARFGLKPAQKVDTPFGEKTEEELLKEQMRPPNQRPQPLPKAHASHGGTVVQVSPEAQARGFKP